MTDMKFQTQKMIYERRNCPTCGEINWIYMGSNVDPIAATPEVCVCFSCATPFWLLSEEVVNAHYVHQRNIEFVLGRDRV